MTMTITSPVNTADVSSLTPEQQQAYAVMMNHLATWASAYVCSENYLVDGEEDIVEASKVLGLDDPEDFANGARFWVSIEKDGRRTAPIAF